MSEDKLTKTDAEKLKEKYGNRWQEMYGKGCECYSVAQLISELEKRGVLTWEVGDIAVWIGEKCLVVEVFNSTRKITLQTLNRTWRVTRMKDCTHSADDPRLLGRCLQKLGDDLLAIINYKTPKGLIIEKPHIKVSLFNGDFKGDTLLHAALLAWLAKVEGEES